MKLLSASTFLERASSLDTFDQFVSLRKESLDTENCYRELFARQRDSWEVPEVDDPLLFLIHVFENPRIFRKLPDFPQDSVPRCFPLENKIPAGNPCTVSEKDFSISWECFTEGLLRFVNWNNVVCAGGAVSGCLTPLPKEIQEAGPSKTRVLRRKYFHDQYLPSSDIDLFLYGLDEDAAVEKLREIYDSIQASSPYEIRAFRSAHAVTLVSRYPFRHVQIVLRLYNSPSEVLMGFDVDSCAVGYNGKNVFMCPRAVLSFLSQTNTVDMTRRSPSYEMRLAKYAERGFEIVVDTLNRDRIDPFLYERRFDQNKGLARLIMMERLRTPEERLRYRLQGSLKKENEWVIRNKIRKIAGDSRNVERAEGQESIVPNVSSSAESSNYSTVFLPWGPQWTVDKIERMTKKKDKILNAIEFLPDGRVVANRKDYKIHVCAVGSIDEIVVDPFPDDPPIPDDVPKEALEVTVRGTLSWLVDNPGRQQIGSFHPVNDEDWTEGTYIFKATEGLILAANANDAVKLADILDGDDGRLLRSRDFLGRTALHVASLAGSVEACRILLEQPGVDASFIQARLADGRTALHLAALRGNVQIGTLILNCRNTLIDRLIEDGMDETDAILEVLDVDCSDWDAKMSPLHYAVVLGHADMAKLLLSTKYGANARKVAVHKDQNKSLSVFDLLAMYASESGKVINLPAFRDLSALLADAGASAAQVNTSGSTAWHTFASCNKPSSVEALKIALNLHCAKNNGKAIGLDILDSSAQTPLYVATACGNPEAISLLLESGATALFSEEEWEARVQKAREVFLSGGRSYHYSNRGSDGIMRCPIFVAAKNADPRCLRAFLSHDKALANTPIRIPKKSIRHRGQNEMATVHPLNIVQRTRAEMESTESNTAAQRERKLLNDRIGILHKKYEKAVKKRDSFPSDSYKHYAWKIICHQLELSEKGLESMVESPFLQEEYELEEKMARTQIEAAATVLREFGGESVPEEEVKEDTVQQSPIPQAPAQTDIQDPWDSFEELDALSFAQAANLARGNYRSHRQARSISPGQQTAIRSVFESAWRGKIAPMRCKLCVVDSCGVTPLFVASMIGSTSVFSAIYKNAGGQFQRFVQKQNSLKQSTEKKEDDNENVVKDQLRRLNNLDIAAGEVPRGAGPTPDMIRQRLEAAEQAALNQSSVKKQNEDIVNDEVTSSTPPESMLLYRSVALSHEALLPRLREVQTKMHDLHGLSFPDDIVGKPVRLRPIEVAVLRGDIDMLKCIQGLVFDDAPKTQDVDRVEHLLAEEDDHSSSYGGSDYSSRDDDDSETGHFRASQLPPSHLKYLLYGEGSRNPDLNVTLIQLAIALDDMGVLLEIAKVAREHLLPRAAIGLWKKEFYDNEEGLSEEQRFARENITKKIMGESSYDSWQWRVPLWAPTSAVRNSESMLLYPTLIQMALSFDSTNITSFILSGKADEPLLGWIAKAGEPHLGWFQKKEVSELSSYDDLLIAAGWLCEYTSKMKLGISALAQKLLSVWAPDAIGRTALFYSPVTQIANVAVSAATFTGSNPVAVFLDAKTRKGHLTALMAAASAKELDRVEALIKAGCTRSIACGPNSWGALHMALPSPALISRAKAGQETKALWTTSRKIIEAILTGASESEAIECMLSPKRCSPLMVAVDRGAPSEIIWFLVDKMGEKASIGLAARDADLNTLLHHAVTSSKTDAVEALLKQDPKPPELSPEVENSTGTTPVESALATVTCPWSRSSKTADRRLVPAAQFNRSRQTSRTLPPKLTTGADLTEPSGGRQFLALFKDVQESKPERNAVGFEAVKEARAGAAEKARKASTGQTDEAQSHPTGSPMVLPVYTRPYYYRRNREPEHWNGWPTLFHQ